MYNLTRFSGRLYFSGDDCSNGRELWTSDGTFTGTLMLRDIYTGTRVDTSSIEPNSSSPDHFTEFNGALYFTASDGVHGTELWKTGGAYTNTVMVKDIVSGTSPSLISEMIVFSNTLFFVADDGNSNFGEELWTTDGTLTGTQRLTDIKVNSGDSNISQLTVVDDLGLLFFTAESSNSNTELWVTDGTLTNTVLVKDIKTVGGSLPSYLTALGSRLLFRATDNNDSELWTTDGTLTNTVEIDIYPGGSSSPVGIRAFGPTAFFAADSLTSAGEPWLWATNGVTVTEIAQINAGAGGNPDFVAMGLELYFRAYDTGSNIELWKTNGTALGTVMVKEINPTQASNPFGMFVMPGGAQMLFAADDGAVGSELWITDGSEPNTELVANIAPDVASGFPSALTPSGGSMYLQSLDATLSFGLWRSDNLTSATLVTDVIALSGNPPYRLDDGGRLLFPGDDGVNGAELWLTDGTPAGTVLLKDMHMAGDGSPQEFVRLGDTVFFSGVYSSTGRELWSTQGAGPSTALVADIRLGVSGSNPERLTVYNNQLYFFADDGLTGGELWLTDGATTQRISDINTAGDAVGTDDDMAVSSGRLYFSANGLAGDDNNELWQYDGVTVTLAAEINPVIANGGSLPQQLTDVAGTLYFVADDGASGYELWQMVGGVASLVADIAPGPTSSGITDLVAVGSTLFFSANNGTHGRELWKATGGAASLVKDIYPGITGSLPAYLVNVQGTLVFAAADILTGKELWQSDGTLAGTQRIQNIALGPLNSNPSEMTLVRDRLYFRAFSQTAGWELWGLHVGIDFVLAPVVLWTP